MAKKKEVEYVPLPTNYAPVMNEKRRKELFPNNPPPTLRELKEAKNQQKQ